MKYFHILLAVLSSALMAGCGGGGNSTVTTITGPGLDASGAGPSVSLPFVQQANNLKVTVESGGGFSSQPSANILYTTVTVCEPNGGRCQDIDHVQVDTGSIGLRILASKVSSLKLPGVMLDSASGSGQAWECLPFVIGGLWGGVVQADVGMGQEKASRIPIQLIDDMTQMKDGPLDCQGAANGHLLSSASALDSNGILGIGSMSLDCGQTCIAGNYAENCRLSAVIRCFEMYRSCPVDATDVHQCKSAVAQANQQVFNPVAALAVDNNGIVLSMPPVTGLGAATASGELIFGIGTQGNNRLADGATKVHLGVDWQHNYESYLKVTTLYNGNTIFDSYLDTGTNGLIFTDSGNNRIAKCLVSDWYCPTDFTVKHHAVLSDGDAPQSNQVAVQFGVGNAETLFSIQGNSAFGDLAGAPPSSTDPVVASFSWGMPFFYGKKVYLSIWDPYGRDPMFSSGPWYAWTSI